ncbi:MAG: hypothetical protein IJG06_08085, partial [Clostridia bacterium]|nr:hypothetical protein [Clostridia bacterium]
MKKNRFISIVVTLTMLLSSLSGLTAITANAEGETDAPALTDLKLMERYTATFSSWTAGTDVLETYDTDNWTYTGRVGKNGNYIDVKAEKDGVASGVLTFNNTTDSGAFYYKYSVRMTNTGARNTVSLCGVDDAVVLTSPMSDTSGYYAYTTVIDNETGKAYTYNAAGAVVNTVSFTGTVTGLKFASTANNLLISSFSYGKIVNVPELSSYTLFEKHSSTFSDWTAADGDLTSYDSDNWTKSGRLGINGNMVQIQAASGTLDDGELTYNKAADDGVFYYKYKVRMTGDKNQNTISLAGVNDAVVLVSPITDTSSTYEFTTVVDDNMAYTYDSTGNYVKTAEFTGKVTGLTFKSTSGKEIRIQEIHYGVMINPPALSDYVQVQEHKADFSTWTADDGDNTLTGYDETNWTASGRLGVT